MKNGRFSDAQIMGILKQADGGVAVSELCREHGMSRASFSQMTPKFSISGDNGNAWVINNQTGEVNLCSSLGANMALNNWISDLMTKDIVPECTGWSKR